MKRTYWKHCHVATMRDGRYNAIEDAVIVTRGKHIEWVGPRGERSASGSDLCIDLQGAWVTPGLIDCHTHLVFGGNRSQEFEQRLQGVSYAEISAAGGGIRHTVRHTRDATEDALFVSARKRLLALMRDGVTTVEIKSGYGLDLNSERKMLRVARRLGESLPVTVKTTCLAAHTVPMEFAGKADEYVNYVCSEILPTLAEERLVDAVDAFCETIAFTPAQVMRVLLRAQKLKLPVKLHAEQLSPLGGSSMAAELGALSADHLEYMTPEDAAAMGRAGTVAVLLPGAFHMLQETRRPPVDLLRRHGVDIAVASDLNPGTSPALSLRLMLNMACTLFGLTPEEALAGVTRNAAKALGMLETHGTIEAGKSADFVAWEIERPAELTYWLGGALPSRTVRNGEWRDPASA
ncbi:imidazolonepropionase [Pandoraea pnomenusa]|jgi:imidazolonepropionase|uniref:Imidazolonepropionase n=1 Tax=Pandoraea pnomenusa TaxID=93220 RepID=A0A378YCK9_9BURK|nr:imidazolonepropionase [Pandoraea pnomenusa]AHB05876.1 imidazolonepropionase [Pandoraea pnomenusa 3kgm]AHN73650.1 imidazolonepropionase [Pandoraea pnomenusa]AIU25589.1 imidazolonepropionase [Pandoraea pnomenusa]ANC46725.1 imidazolonepropionase [Pandoraea pnomenusa]MBN9095272.1 imidazolonepropionase [Pandoraea pnomenusa]